MIATNTKLNEASSLKTETGINKAIVSVDGRSDGAYALELFCVVLDCFGCFYG
ncbi:uncharacterized protein G2W53_007469 [Senna tora]|uniref:Uncharacterized protein n=1 Tax=Senna tora TaxID=362788 RepID=A0A834X6B7_9FABA|nr:uncharacterized protein G2W53_007469 [Senna tora]